MGTPERRRFVASLPCAACGVVGYSQNAHVVKGDKGMGYKAHHTCIAPLCGPNHYYIGCHRFSHQDPSEFRKGYPHFNPEEVAAETERLWRAASEQKLPW